MPTYANRDGIRQGPSFPTPLPSLSVPVAIRSTLGQALAEHSRHHILKLDAVVAVLAVVVAEHLLILRAKANLAHVTSKVASSPVEQLQEEWREPHHQPEPLT